MTCTAAIDGAKRPRKKGRPPTSGSFGQPGRDPRVGDKQAAALVRWSQDRRELVAMAREARPEAFATVLTIMRDERVEAPTRLRAGELILAYSDGRPRQAVDVAIGGPREMSTLSRVELEAIARGAPPPYQLQHNGVTIEGEAFAPAPLSEKAVSRSRKGISPGA